KPCKFLQPCIRHTRSSEGQRSEMLQPGEFLKSYICHLRVTHLQPKGLLWRRQFGQHALTPRKEYEARDVTRPGAEWRVGETVMTSGSKSDPTGLDTCFRPGINDHFRQRKRAACTDGHAVTLLSLVCANTTAPRLGMPSRFIPAHAVAGADAQT